MPYLIFNNITNFNTWHTKVKKSIGLPKVGVNAETGELEPEAQKTTGYTQAIKHPNTTDLRVLAFVGDDLDSELISGLTLIDQEEAKNQGWFPAIEMNQIEQ